jgi:hypothetical protein
MKVRISIIIIAVLCLGCLCGCQSKAPAEAIITVLNPMGTPPPITLIPQAPRLDTLDGKTLYLINTGYIGTDRFMAEAEKWFKANYPKTNIVYRDNRSGAGLSSLSEALWAEIAEKGDAAVVGLGH